MSGEECQLAFKASLELLEEKCGVKVGGSVARFDELKTAVRVPPEVLEATGSNPELSRKEKIKAVMESSWAEGWAEGMCRLVTGETEESCLDRMKRTLAERVV